jgi:lysylphosphatidylglycerol synthetase-like protein (DUF2156 family)
MDANVRVRLVVVLTALGGLGSLLTLTPVLHRQVQGFDEAVLPIQGRSVGHALSLVCGVGLLYLAGQLRRRKRRAWELTAVLFAVSAIVHALKGPHLYPAVFAVAMLGVLWWAREDFTARSDPPTYFRLVWFVPTYVALVYGYGIITLRLERDEITPSVNLGDNVVTVTKGLVGLDGPYRYHDELFAHAFPASLVVLGILGLVALGWLIFRPIVSQPDPDPGEWEHATRLVREYGWDTLAYFALRDDKSFFFSSDGEAMVAYTYLGRTALVSADPIGRSESISLLLDEFLEFCRNRSWSVGFMGAREADVDLYEAHGLHHFYLGDEAILHCRAFTLAGTKMKSLRQSVGRVAKQFDYHLVLEPDASPELIDKFNAISERWRGKNPERGFTMALSEDVTGKNPDFVIGYAIDHDDTIGGFLRFVPAYGDDYGYTMDLMRHDPDAPNGMTEFLMSNTALGLGELGFDRLSMNFAAWSRLWQSDIEFSRAQKVGRFLVQKFNPYFQIKSLYDFNAKFKPEWWPRTIIYDSTTSLPRVGILFGGVEGLLNLPLVGRYFVPRVVTSPDEVADIRAQVTARPPDEPRQ